MDHRESVDLSLPDLSRRRAEGQLDILLDSHRHFTSDTNYHFISIHSFLFTNETILRKNMRRKTTGEWICREGKEIERKGMVFFGTEVERFDGKMGRSSSVKSRFSRQPLRSLPE